MRRPRASGFALVVALVASAVACSRLPAPDGLPYRAEEASPQVTSIGHATFLIDVGGRRILTDPWFYERPLTGRHPEPLGLAPDRLPPLDLLLVTHGHRDHFDARFLREFLDKNVSFVVPRGMAGRVERLGFARVHGLVPWDRIEVEGVAVTAVPAVHVGETLAYVVEAGGSTIYFAAETVLFQGFERVARRFPRIDVAFLPADGLRLRWGRRLALDPHDALRAIETLGPGVVIPILDHDFSRSVARLVLATPGSVEALAALMARTRTASRLVVLRPGERWRPSPSEAPR
jgi:L-ascorbate metabolism protein UlaG (beta-lactamase superfamily)